MSSVVQPGNGRAAEVLARRLETLGLPREMGTATSHANRIMTALQRPEIQLRQFSDKQRPDDEVLLLFDLRGWSGHAEVLLHTWQAVHTNDKLEFQ